MNVSLFEVSNAFSANLAEVSNTSNLPYIVAGIAVAAIIFLAPVVSDYITSSRIPTED